MAKCVPCLSKEIKAAIREKINDARTMSALEEIPDCPSGTDMQLCGGKKRKTSAYQEFVGQCLRDKKLTHFDPSALKDCAAQWRKQKK
jgi:hypothetical protein